MLDGGHPLSRLKQTSRIPPSRRGGDGVIWQAEGDYHRRPSNHLIATSSVIRQSEGAASAPKKVGGWILITPFVKRTDFFIAGGLWK